MAKMPDAIFMIEKIKEKVTELQSKMNKTPKISQKIMKEDRSKLEERTNLLFESALSNTRSNKYEDALNDFTSYIELKEDDDGYFNRALVKEELGDLEGAINDYRKAMQISNKNYDAYWNLAILNFNLKKYNEALDLFLDLFKLTKEYHILIEIIKSKIILKDYKSSLLDIELLLSKEGTSEMDLSSIYFNKYVAHYELNEKDKALESINQAINYDKESSINYLLRGSLYLEKNDKSKAKNDFLYAKMISNDEELINDLNDFIKKCGS